MPSMAGTMNLKLTPARLLAGAIVVLAAWIVHGFIQALLAAGVTAIASWPLYLAFRARLPHAMRRRAAAVIFTAAITLLLLAPLVFAGWALLDEANALLHGLAAGRWQEALARSGALPMLTQHTDPGALLGWAQSLGQFTFRHALIVGFTILLLGFLYQHGGALAREFTVALQRTIGDRADRYVEVGTRAVRASVNSMLVVGLYDGAATAVAYAAAGAPRPLLWAAITGALAAVPFLVKVALSRINRPESERGCCDRSPLREDSRDCAERRGSRRG